MRLITRNDASLVVGLVASAVVIFQRPLRLVWEVAGDVQERYHVDLLPALTILVGVFLFHEARKRQQAKAEGLVVAAEAAQARMRSSELERLMTLSQALASALDPTTLEQVLWRHLPALAGEREFWVLARRSDRWETLLPKTTVTRRQSWEEVEALDRELERAHRSRQPLSILMFDIDRFKTINDELGHLRGDDLLRAVGAQLTRVLRSTDVRCRYGGDEFLIILPDTPLIGAQQAAESVRRKMAPLAMLAEGKTFPVTVSVGVAEAGPGELGAAALIKRADDALYQAKREGRNRCSVAGAPPLSVVASEPQAIEPSATGFNGL